MFQVNGQVSIKTVEEQFVLSLVEKGEEPEIRHYLEMLGHHEWTEEGVIISDVLEKKGRVVTHRFVI